MTPEPRLWAYIKKGMGKRWDASRHEDICTSGVPDISFGIKGTGGWIELKTLKNWPRDTSKLLRVRMRPAQVQWLIRRVKHCPSIWILIKIQNDYILLHASYASKLNSMTQYDLRDVSTKIWSGKIDWDQLSQVLI